MILSTLIRADSGEINIKGLNPSKNLGEIRKKVGLISHEHFLYHNLTVAENMKFFGELYRVNDLPQKTENILKRLVIFSKKDELVRNLSNGMKQRVSIARAILHEPDIMLLDEPSVGLDYEGLALLSELILEYKNKDKTVVITTHDINLGLQNADTVYILDKGVIKSTRRSSELDVTAFENEYKNLIFPRPDTQLS